MKLIRDDLTAMDYMALIVGSTFTIVSLVAILTGHINEMAINLGSLGAGMLFAYCLIDVNRIDRYKKEIVELKAKLYEKRVEKDE